ncbi:MAG: DciA family protein [Candidatus Omnitrophota bacterium]
MDNIEDIIKNVIGKIADRKLEDHQKIYRLWISLLNESELKHTKLIGVNNGKVSVHVDSPAWLYQMNTRKRKILESLKEEISNIEYINFKIGKIK